MKTAAELPSRLSADDGYPVVPGNDQLLGSRERQEDCLGFSEFEDARFVEHGGYLGAIADGMGGFAAGAEASAAAIGAFLESYLKKAADESIPDALSRSLQAANDAVYQLSISPKRKLGTTLTAAVVHGRTLYWIGAGDSRAYLKRRNAISCLTEDHVFSRTLDEKVAALALSASDAAEHPDRAALTSYLGDESVAEICCNPEPLSLEPGDYVLLCTDGVSGVLAESDLIEALDGSAQQAAEKVIELVRLRNHPKQDNASAAVLAYAPVGISADFAETNEMPSLKLHDSEAEAEQAPAAAAKLPGGRFQPSVASFLELARKRPWVAYFIAVVLLIFFIWCCS